MNDNDSRKLRPRRAPHYPHADNQDIDNFAYTKTSFMKDFVSPAQELNSMAKALSKFINSANKKLIQQCNEKEEKEGAWKKGNIQSQQQANKKGQSNIDAGKKKQNTKNEIKDNTSRVRDASGSKDPTKQQIETSNKLKNAQYGKKQRDLNKNSRNLAKPAQKNSNSFLSKLDELKNLQTMEINFNNIKKMQLDAAAKAFQQQQELLNYNPSLRQKMAPQFQLKKQDTNNEKFFKRCAFHIAIAYNIHLNNIRQNQRQRLNPQIMDPTYPAKKLKGTFQAPLNNNPSNSKG